MVRFMHFSDTHIGNRQYYMEEREQDFMDSFSEAVSIGLKEKVDFFIHSGDLFDVWNPSNRSLAFLRDSMIELKEKGIKVYMVLGDHDRPKRVDYPAAEIFDFLGITVLGKDGFQGMDLEINGESLFLGGISNMKGIRRDRLPEEYRKASSAAEGKKNSVLISHQGVTGFGLIDEACEIKKEEIPGNFSYLAFGHIHEGATSRIGNSLFSYAGSSEICSTNEIQSFLKRGKGVNLVEISGGEAELDRIPLNSVRVQASIKADGNDYMDRIVKFLDGFQNKIKNKRPIISVEISGDVDRGHVKTDLDSLSERAIIRKPVFQSLEMHMERRPDLTMIDDYFKAYFRDDEMALLAKKIFESTQSEDKEQTLKQIRELFGIGGAQ
ncbi:exonuclease SbcCD subunit D [Oxyplasma meridianum]|uniref:DNA double-strand break repair protein Mre11 n=1 Tax=Oxyplasma meridianum TaxID=3073602 RepID=A0AAX4NE04_9ARCH